MKQFKPNSTVMFLEYYYTLLTDTEKNRIYVIKTDANMNGRKYWKI
jgi:hypothetical protein